MPFDPRRIKALFLSAHDLADDDARAVLLDRECGNDVELQAMVADLLAVARSAATVAETVYAGDPGET